MTEEIPNRKSSRHSQTSFEGDGSFGYDPVAAVAHLRAADKTFAKLIEAAGPFGMQLRSTPSTFVALSESIVHQQLNGRAAAAIYARLCALFPRPKHGPTPKGVLRLSDAELRGAGLSGSKLLALRDLAQKTVEGMIPTLSEMHGMAEDLIIERLTAVRGIGRWTVEMLLISRLGRPDILPVDDFGVRNGFMIAFKRPAMPSRQELAARAERWKPYRSVASWYLWRAVDLAKKRD